MIVPWDFSHATPDLTKTAFKDDEVDGSERPPTFDWDLDLTDLPEDVSKPDTSLSSTTLPGEGQGIETCFWPSTIIYSSFLTFSASESKKRKRAAKKISTDNVKKPVAPSRKTSLFPEKYRPLVAAHRHRSKYLRRSMVAAYLRKVFADAEVLKCDFDLAVAFFLQETRHLKLGPIPRSVKAVLDDFTILAPCTGQQDNILKCALEIHEAVLAYQANPGSEKPFALRFPTLKHLHNLAIERSRNAKVVGKDHAGILVDLHDRLLAVGVPPKVHPTAGAPPKKPEKPAPSNLPVLTGAPAEALQPGSAADSRSGEANVDIDTSAEKGVESNAPAEPDVPYSLAVRERLSGEVSTPFRFDVGMVLTSSDWIDVGLRTDGLTGPCGC